MVFAKKSKQRREGALLENVITTLGRVASDVAKGPDGLLADVKHGRRKEGNEVRNGTGLKDDLSVLRRARGNVGERPGGLELSR